ncbi:hypothetical protein ACHMW6_07100 [Pseudoduganella sp. UC29_106]|uniref:hypothetical protein n=1 Tax=Pseudoduganella sp. UC29_106 TaxID=3374553 RepID=UPI003756C4CA
MKTLRILILVAMAWALYALAASVAHAQATAAGRHAAAQLEVRRIKANELLPAARLVLDGGLREFNWTREESLDYLVQYIGLTEAEARRELTAAEQRARAGAGRGAR